MDQRTNMMSGTANILKTDISFILFFGSFLLNRLCPKVPSGIAAQRTRAWGWGIYNLSQLFVTKFSSPVYSAFLFKPFSMMPSFRPFRHKILYYLEFNLASACL